MKNTVFKTEADFIMGHSVINKGLTMSEILQVVSEFTGISEEDIKSHHRKREKVEARQLYLYFCNQFTKFSSTAIGETLNRDHTTVIHSFQVVNDRLDTEEGYRVLASNIRKELTKRAYKVFDADGKLEILEGINPPDLEILKSEEIEQRRKELSKQSKISTGYKAFH